MKYGHEFQHEFFEQKIAKLVIAYLYRLILIILLAWGVDSNQRPHAPNRRLDKPLCEVGAAAHYQNQQDS